MENKRAEMLFFSAKKKILIYTHNGRIIIVVRRKRNENKRLDRAIRKQWLEVQAARWKS